MGGRNGGAISINPLNAAGRARSSTRRHGAVHGTEFIMTTLSPLTSSLLQMLGAGGGSSSGTANAAVASVLGQVQAAKGAGATTAEALRQTLVTLSSQNGTANSSSVQTYNAKGLLNQVQA